MSDSGNDGNRDPWNSDFHNQSHLLSNLYVNQDNLSAYNNLTQQQQQLQQQQQQHISPPATQSPGSNYTMLSVGHGNYLKVYHNTDERDDFTKYELFSSKTFIPPHNIIKQMNSSATPANDGLMGVGSGSGGYSASNTNSLLNQLVGNLGGSQNISGTYSPFGESMTIPQNTNPPMSMNHHTHHHTTYINEPQNVVLVNNSPPMGVPLMNTSTALMHDHFVDSDSKIKVISPKQHAEPIKKPRIVAEVKPMRMSYSDVLSQNVAINNAANENAMNTNAVNISTNTPIKSTTAAVTNTANNKANKIGNFTTMYDKKGDENRANKKNGNQKSTSNASSNLPVGGNLYGASNTNNGNSNNVGENQAQQSQNTSGSDRDRKNISAGSGISDSDSKSKRKANKGLKTNKFATNARNDNHRKMAPSNINNSSNLDEDENDEDDDEYDEDVDYMDENDNNNEYYGVTKTINPDAANNPNIEKIGNLTIKKNRLSNPPAKNLKTQAKLSSSGSSSSSKRNKSSSSVINHRSQQYVFLQNMLEKWMEWMLKFIKWLFILISDIVLLSFSILWDHINFIGKYLLNWCSHARNEIKNNKNNIFRFTLNWFKKSFKKFDGRFAKNSKWAIWRKIFMKKKVVEPVSDFYKNGRLPQTGDEAMYSLLNCKGKDAYSILGVAPDCTQEQIRKHYKKIAVLVHPDKNKQPGAEEAFKILQRAFELIGEPENRKSYDQSVAEALHAEKAWSELNDLLAQLHTKIAEAANTIRCSSCGLRHPRKPTGRPHYAARECNSCKIRHSAREGDIWAETSFFGLRWKYLALMEGTVYDITEWANCQKSALAHLQPNSHIVQYRIVLGGQQQQNEKDKIRKNIPTSEPNLDDFLNNLYGSPNQSTSSSRRRSKKN